MISIKIAIISEFYISKNHPYGGIETTAHGLCQQLTQKGHKINVICSKRVDEPKNETIEGVPINRIGKEYQFSYQGRNKFNRLKFLIKLFFNILKFGKKYDLIHSFSPFTHIPVYFASKLRNIPIISSIHDVEPSLTFSIKNIGIINGMINYIFAFFYSKLKYHRIITGAYSVKCKLMKIYGIMKNRISVIPNAIDLDFFKSIDSVKATEPTITCISRIVTTKNIVDLIYLTENIKKSLPNIHTLIIGDGPLREKLEALTKELGLDQNVSFLKFIPSKRRVFEIVKSSHVFVFPSTYEGFGLALLEAGACGVPGVGYNIPGIYKAPIYDNINGFLVDSRNVNLLTEKILELLKNNNLRLKIGKKAEKMAEKYTWDQVSKQYLEMYQKIK